MKLKENFLSLDNTRKLKFLHSLFIGDYYESHKHLSHF